jgi:hypothetical protein
MVQRGESSRLCPFCLALSRRANVRVLPEHKIWWRAKRDGGYVTASGEQVTQDWIEEVADLIWG